MIEVYKISNDYPHLLMENLFGFRENEQNIGIFLDNI